MRPPVVVIKVGTVGKGSSARINHIVCKTWDPDSVENLHLAPDCFLPGDENAFSCIVRPDDEALAHARSELNRGVTVKEMETAKPFVEHVDALLAFLKGKQIAVFSLGHVRGSLNRELARLGHPELPKSEFIHVSPRLTQVFKKEADRPADRKLDTYAQHFGVEDPRHAVKRCNASRDVDVLASVYSHLVDLERKHGITAGDRSDASSLVRLGVLAAPKDGSAKAAVAATSAEAKEELSPRC